MSIISEDLTLICKNLEYLKKKIEGRTLLITGGAGFLGSWFCDVALELGAEVICVDNMITGANGNIAHLAGNKKFTLAQKSILDFETGKKVDFIVHMASIASPGLYQKHPIETMDSNLLGIRKMLDLAKKNNAQGVLFTSTSEVYGNPPDGKIPTSEDYYGYVNSYGPRSMYDEAKRAAEAYCYSYFKEFGIHVRIARIFNTYGPRLDVKSTSQYGRALVKFVVQALAGESISIYGDGAQTRSFCYITDQMTGLFKLLLTDNIDGEVVNIGNSKETTINELINKTIKLTGSKSKLVYNSPPNYDIRDDPRRRCPNITKAKKLLNYEPKVGLDEGLKRTIAWFKEGKI